MSRRLTAAVIALHISLFPVQAHAQYLEAAGAMLWDRYNPDIWRGVDFLAIYEPHCNSWIRFNDGIDFLNSIGTPPITVDKVRPFKTWLHASDWNLRCGNKLMRDAGVFEQVMTVFEAAGASTRSRWHRSKCYNTTPYGHMTWEEAHNAAVDAGKTGCMEYQFETQPYPH